MGGLGGNLGGPYEELRGWEGRGGGLGVNVGGAGRGIWGLSPFTSRLRVWGGAEGSGKLGGGGDGTPGRGVWGWEEELGGLEPAEGLGLGWGQMGAFRALCRAGGGGGHRVTGQGTPGGVCVCMGGGVPPWWC